MSWVDGFAAFDVESTGVDVESDRIVTASVVRVAGAALSGRNWIVNPGVEIPQAAIDVHGITNDEAREFGMEPATAVAQIFAELDECWSLGMPVVIYNASFDLSMLDRELRRHCGVELGDIGPIIDPLVLDKHYDRYRKGSRTLTAVAAHYGVAQDQAHSSNGDALTAARVAYKLAKTYRIDDELTLAQLQTEQAAWHQAQKESFAKYLESQGKDTSDVDPHWPIRPYRERVTT